MTNIKYRINVVGNNNSGTLLFCIFKADKKTLARGVFNFDTERFSVISWNKTNLKKKGLHKKKAREILKNELQKERQESPLTLVVGVCQYTNMTGF